MTKYKNLVAVIDTGGAKIDPVIEQVLGSLGIPVIYDKIEGCAVCKHFACVCVIRKNHKEGCKFLRAATCDIAVECDHGYDVCHKCDPCTCKEL